MSTPSNWEFFSEEELACRCGKCGRGAEWMDKLFMSRLVTLRKACGFALPVTSAYRCPDWNEKVSSTGKEGPHTTGKAVDIAIDRARARVVVGLADDIRFPGLGVQQKGDKRFIHLDGLGARIWSY